MARCCSRCVEVETVSNHTRKERRGAVLSTSNVRQIRCEESGEVGRAVGRFGAQPERKIGPGSSGRDSRHKRFQSAAVCLVVLIGLPAPTEGRSDLVAEEGYSAPQASASTDTVSMSSEAGMELRVEVQGCTSQEGQPELGIRMPRARLQLRRSVEFVDQLERAERDDGEIPRRFTRTFESLSIQAGEPWPGVASASIQRGVSPLEGRSLTFSRRDGAWGAVESADERPLSSVWLDGLEADRAVVDLSILDWLEPDEAGSIPSGRLRSLLAPGGDHGFDARAWTATLPEGPDTISIEEGRGRAAEKALELAVWGCLATGEFAGEASLAASGCDRRTCAERGGSCLEVSFDVQVTGAYGERLVELHSWAEGVEPSGGLPRIPGMRSLTTKLELEGVAHLVVAAEGGRLVSVEIEAEIHGEVQMDNYTSLLRYEWDGGSIELSLEGRLRQRLEFGRD